MIISLKMLKIGSEVSCFVFSGITGLLLSVRLERFYTKMENDKNLHLCNVLILYFFCFILSASLRSCSACASLRRACSRSRAHCSTHCS